MRYITLSNKQQTTVDDEDYEYLNQWKWQCSSGYAIKNNGRIKMHRLIVDAPKHLHVDHINGNTLDNRKSNLRLCNRTQNQGNSKLRKDKRTSKYKGVSWHKASNKWTAQITKNNKRIYLGIFKLEKEAALAYNKAAIDYFKEFAKLNDV